MDWNIVVMFAVTIGTGLFVWWKHTDDLWRPLLPWIAVTVAGILLAAGMYLWTFEVGSTCADRGDFGCQMNANQGLLTLLGLVLAAAALWTTAVTRYLDRRHEQHLLDLRVDGAVSAALEEIHHNLVHVALAYDDEMKLIGFPALRADATRGLLEPPVRDALHQGVLHSAETIVRNHETFDRLVKGIKVDDGTGEADPEPFCLQAFVTQSIGAMLWAGGTTTAGHDFLHRPGLQDLHQLAMADSWPYYCFRTSDSDFKAEIATLRTEERDVLCWWDDEPPGGLNVYVEGLRYRDLSRSHTPH